jgi:hypothetical protein
MSETKTKLRDYGIKRCEATAWRIVREVGARRYHIAIDLTILK